MRIAERFLSIQGEGRMIGRLTYFIRTSGCSLRCKWCDTAWQRGFDSGEEMSVAEIVSAVPDVHDICLTGGEPLEQPGAAELVQALTAMGKRVTVETNGAADISPIAGNPGVIVSMDVKCPGSGMEGSFLVGNLRFMEPKDQLKFVISDRADLDYAEAFLRNNEIRSEVIFSAVGGIDIKSLAEEAVQKNLDVRVLPQLHKFIWGDRRGVRD